MSTSEEDVLSVQEVLRLYADGTRDFRSVNIGPGASGFENKRLDDADFSGSFLVVSFEGAGLRNTKFSRANVKTCTFDGADLTGATFEGAAVDGASFARVDLRSTNFAGATEQGHAYGAGEVPAPSASDLPGRHERFQRSLDAQMPKDSLRALALSLRDEGETREQVLGLFDLFRSDHHEDHDETLYDAILEVMDMVSGWCRPDAAVFREE